MDTEPQSSQNRGKSTITIIVGTILLAGVCGLLGVIVGINWPPPAPPETSEPSPISPSPTPTDDITAGAVLRRIETTSILQATVYRIDTVVRAKKEGSWFFNYGGQNIILFAQGSVTAGVDLGEIKESNVKISQGDRTITITLPAVKILSASLDEYTVETFEGEKPDEVNLDLLQEGLQAGQDKIREIACTDKILERATTDSKSVFQDMMDFVEFDDFVIVVESSPTPICEFEVKVKPN